MQCGRSVIHFKESWSVLVVNLVFSKYGNKKSTVHTLAKPPGVVSYRRLVSVSDLEQYAIG